MNYKYLLFILIGIIIFLLWNKYNTFSIGGDGLLTEYIDDISQARKYMFTFLSNRFSYWLEDTNSNNIVITRGGNNPDTLHNDNEYNIGNIRVNGLTNQMELLIGTVTGGRIYEVTLEINDTLHYQVDEGERLDFLRAVTGVDGYIDLEYIGPDDGVIRQIYLEMIDYINENRGEPGGLHIMRRRFCASGRV
jgi:hypothetical protein